MAVGLLLAFLSGGVTATSSLLVKLSSDGGTTVLQAAFYRNIIMVFIWTVLLSLSGNDLRTMVHLPSRTIAMLLLRSVSSFVGLVSIYAVYQLLPLGDAAAIAGSAPIFAGVFGALILGETWAGVQVILSLVCWFGVALVVKTNDVSVTNAESSPWNPKIVSLAIVAPMSIALSLVFSRKISKTVKTTHVMMVTFIGISICALISMALTEGVHVPGVSTWKYFVGDAFAGLLSQWLLTKALSQENAAPVVLMRNSRVVVGFIYQVFIYHQTPTLQSLSGAAVIISSVVMTTLLT